jgi:hypothetical protein
MNGDTLSKVGNGKDSKSGAGRTELPDDQKSDKTIKNRESMN